jgi:hypothetical protein
MCVMKRSDDWRVLLDFGFWICWPFCVSCFRVGCLAVNLLGEFGMLCFFLFQSCLHVHRLVVVCCCCPASVCCLVRRA